MWITSLVCAIAGQAAALISVISTGFPHAWGASGPSDTQWQQQSPRMHLARACFRCCFPEQPKNLIRKRYFCPSYISSLPLQEGRGAAIQLDGCSYRQTCRLGAEKCPTGGQEGKEEEEREEVLVHSERQTPQGCRLEPAVKAQGVFGTK